MVKDYQIKPHDAYKDISKLFIYTAVLGGEFISHHVLGLLLPEHLLAVPGLEAVAAGVADAEGGLLLPESHRTDVATRAVTLLRAV